MDKLIEVWVIVSWWEGDFASRDNLKVTVFNHRKKCEAYASTFSEGVVWFMEMKRLS
jgi:hypothetical protein